MLIKEIFNWSKPRYQKLRTEIDFKYYSELKTIFIKFKEYQLIKNGIFFLFTGIKDMYGIPLKEPIKSTVYCK